MFNEAPVFSETFIENCTAKIKQYHNSSERGVLYQSFPFLFRSRTDFKLEENLRAINIPSKECPAEQLCFALLQSLYDYGQETGAKGFQELCQTLQQDICIEIQQNSPQIFQKLQQEANATSAQCDQPGRKVMKFIKKESEDPDSLSLRSAISAITTAFMGQLPEKFDETEKKLLENYILNNEKPKLTLWLPHIKNKEQCFTLLLALQSTQPLKRNHDQGFRPKCMRLRFQVMKYMQDNKKDIFAELEISIVRVNTLVNLGYFNFIAKHPGLEFDIKKTSTWELLEKNVESVRAILKPALHQALENENFYAHVRDKRCTKLDQEVLVQEFDRLKENIWQDLVSAYIDYYLESKENPSSGEENSIFEALAKIYNITVMPCEIQGLKLFYSISNANDCNLPDDSEQRIAKLLSIIFSNPDLFENEILVSKSSAETSQSNISTQATGPQFKSG